MVRPDYRNGVVYNPSYTFGCKINKPRKRDKMNLVAELGLWLWKRSSSRKAEYHYTWLVEGNTVDEMVRWLGYNG